MNLENPDQPRAVRWKTSACKFTSQWSSPTQLMLWKRKKTDCDKLQATATEDRSDLHIQYGSQSLPESAIGFCMAPHGGCG